MEWAKVKWERVDDEGAFAQGEDVAPGEVVSPGYAYSKMTNPRGHETCPPYMAGEYNIAYIALGGGCFHNDILLRVLSARLVKHGLQVLAAQQMQPNDNAISLGQAWVALQTIKRGI
ncbi:MAG: hypothetical protein DID91_2727704754 [Candidatus Nitrotoga sp. MKT]|nr:MAG: hypothetical protein DID91_2727704754 [Candidatus Nitrotoga sp. MKT]